MLYGQEDLGRSLRRLRRARVKVRVGTPMSFPISRVGTQQLEKYTDKIMRALAGMLPQQYQGLYAGVEEEVPNQVSATAAAAKSDSRGGAESSG